MTAMLASVTGLEEAETAVAGGADIIDAKDSSAGALAALPPARIEAIVKAVAGRRQVSAVAGDGLMLPAKVAASVREIGATGVDFIKVGLGSGARRQQALIDGLAEVTNKTRLVGVLFADREGDRLRLIPKLKEAGFSGVMLDTAEKGSGRLLTHVDVAGLAAFVHAARALDLTVGLAGGLEEPDVPRLLALEPDVLGFRGALCSGRHRASTIDLAGVRAIRRLIPPERAGEPKKVDYRLLSARGYHPDTAERDHPARIFVRDFVLPVRIGAYSHERHAPQKVRFDVSADIDRPRGEPQGMGQVFSYDLITDAISAIAAEGHIDFVETLADRIAAQVLRDSRVRRVAVKVEKLEMGPGGVGVEIVMQRQEASSGQNPVLAMLDDVRKPR